MQTINRTAAALLFSATAAVAQEAGEADPGIAVVELFTSEGCSSCPPAERLAEDLIELYSDRPVYVVVYHVDYWDYLGWPDRFATAEHSDRQRAYAARWGTSRIYTPQMIVNGSRRASFVGSDRSRARRSIDRAIGTESSSTLRVSTGDIRPGEPLTVRAELEFEPGDLSDRLSATFAVVEDDVSTDVRRGENAGRTLSHAGVVRAVRTTPIRAGTAQSADLEVPSDVDPEHVRVIVYVQRDSDRVVLAAGSAD